MTTAEIKAALRTIRKLAATSGLAVAVTRSRQYRLMKVDPKVILGPDHIILTIQEALWALS